MRNELSKATSGRSRAPLFPVRKTVLGSRRVRVYGVTYARQKPKQKTKVPAGKSLKRMAARKIGFESMTAVALLLSQSETNLIVF